MQGLCNVPQSSGWLIGVCYVLGFFVLLTLLVIPPYVQSGLNAVWRLYPPAEGSEVELAGAPQPATSELGQAPPPRAADHPG